MFGFFNKKQKNGSELDCEKLSEEFAKLKCEFDEKYGYLLNGIKIWDRHTHPLFNIFYIFIKVIKNLESRIETLEQSDKQVEKSYPNWNRTHIKDKETGKFYPINLLEPTGKELVYDPTSIKLTKVDFKELSSLYSSKYPQEFTSTYEDFSEAEVTLGDITSAVSHDMEQMQKQVDNLEDGLNFMGLSQQQGFDRLEDRLDKLETMLKAKSKSKSKYRLFRSWNGGFDFYGQTEEGTWEKVTDAS